MDIRLRNIFNEVGNQVGLFMRLKDRNENPNRLPVYILPVVDNDRWEFGNTPFVSARPCTHRLEVEGREILLISTTNMVRYELIPRE